MNFLLLRRCVSLFFLFDKKILKKFAQEMLFTYWSLDGNQQRLVIAETLLKDVRHVLVARIVAGRGLKRRCRLRVFVYVPTCCI